MRYTVLAMIVAATLILGVACGNNSITKPPTTSGNPTPTPAPTPAPTPPPTPSTAPDNYSASLLSLAGRNDFVVNSGTVQIDTKANDGTGVLQLQLGSSPPPTGTPFVLLFCPYPTNYQNIPNNFQNCTVLTTFNSTATASQNTQTVNFTMPKGTWGGVFQVIENQVLFASGGMSTSSPGLGFQSAMLPASSVTGGIGTTTGPDTGSGNMIATGSTLQLNITGALPNNTYTVQMCLLSGTCTALGTLASDVSGKISGSVATGNWLMFDGVVALSDKSGTEYISALRSQ